MSIPISLCTGRASALDVFYVIRPTDDDLNGWPVTEYVSPTLELHDRRDWHYWTGLFIGAMTSPLSPPPYKQPDHPLQTLSPGSPPMHDHIKADDSTKASSIVNPTMVEESSQSMKAPSLSQTSSSGLGNLPGTFPRDPHVPLDHLNDHADATDSAHNGSLYDAARDDVRHAFGVAAQYLPQSIVGALGSVLPTATTDAHDVKKKPDLNQASHDNSAGKAKKSIFDPKNTAVAGITSEFHPSTPAHRESSSASSDAPTKPSSAGLQSGADDPLKEGLTETYAPTNFASDSSIDKSSIAPDAMPSPDAGRKDRSNDDEKKPAFVTYAPAPVITDSKSSPGAENTGPSTRQHTAPGVAQALDSTAKKDTSVDRGGSTPSHTSVDRANQGEDKSSNNYPPYAKYAPAPTITESLSPQTTTDRGGVPSQKDVKHKQDLSACPAFASYAPAPGIIDSQSSARATDDSPRSAPPDNQNFSRGKDVQNSDDGETDADSKRKRAAEAAALGAGIGTLGGATYEHSRSPAKGSSATGSYDSFDRTNKGVFSSSSGASQGRGKFASGTGPSGPTTSARDGRDETSIASATDESEPYNGSKHPGVALGGAASTPRKEDNEKEKQADPEHDREAEKARHRREKEAAAAAASAEAAHKRHQKEMEKKQEEAENQAKEREKSVKKHEKEVAAASAAAEKEKRHTEKATQREQSRLEKEAHDREKAAKMHEKDIAAAAVPADKRQGGDYASRDNDTRGIASNSSTAAASDPTKEEISDKNADIYDKRQSPNDEKEPHEIAAAALAASAADRERKRHPNDERDSAPRDSKQISSNDKTSDFSSGGASTRPGLNALARSDSKDAIDPAKSGTDSDFPLEPAEGEGASRVPAVNLDGKGRGATDSNSPRKTTPAKQPEHDRSRYHGTEGVQEKHDGGALKSSTIDKNVGKSAEESDEIDRDHDNGKGEKGFVKHMVEKMKDKFHH